MSLYNELLEYYHLSKKDLGLRCKPGSFALLTKPDGLPSFEAVTARLKKAVTKKERCVIYGDYDVDGLTSTAIMKMGLDELGLNPGFFIPSRYVEGYGLNVKRVEEFAQKGYQLIITVDNGVSAHEAISLAHSLGMEVIVIDHHEVETALPDTPYFFHQNQSGFLDYNCSAASLAFFVISSLLGRMDPYYATLAGIAVFSDIMPLRDNNLVMAKLMLQFVNEYHYPNLSYLLGNGECTYHDINFNLISVLNAPGRIKKDSLATNTACRFFIERNDRVKINKYGAYLVSTNQEKKELAKQFRIMDSYTLESEHALSMRIDGCLGLSGMLANKFMKEKKVPVALYFQSPTDPSLLTCSLRCPEGYHIDRFLEKYKARMVTCGGHEKAAGMTIREKDYFNIATQFSLECMLQSNDLTKPEEKVIPLSLEEITPENYQVLSSFGPFGEGFNEPLFSLCVEKNAFVLSRSGKKACAQNRSGRGQVTLFDQLDLLSLPDVDEFEVHGHFSYSDFQGKRTYEVVGQEVIPH